MSAGSALLSPIDPSLEEQGIQFYVTRYVLGHPEEPADVQSLATSPWLWHPAQQDIMAAVGLAGLSNLLGRQDMVTLARQKYGAALQNASKLISKPTPTDLAVTMRTVVMLALFEVCNLISAAFSVISRLIVEVSFEICSSAHCLS
jgi:hypothetical protein